MLLKQKIIDNRDNVPEIQRAFLELFLSDRILKVDKMVIFSVGALDLSQAQQLLAKIGDERGRQSTDKAKQASGVTSRIGYKSIGGYDHSSEKHNCLTWLRHIFSPFPKLALPRGRLDWLYSDPREMLPANAGLFAQLPSEITVVDTSTWLAGNSLSASTSINGVTPASVTS